MEYNRDFIDSATAKKFVTDLTTLVIGPVGANGEISPEVWAQRRLVDHVEIREEWAGVYQSIDIFRSLGCMHFKSEEEMITSTCASDPLKKLFGEHMIHLRDFEGWELDWWTLNHYLLDVVDTINGNWAFRNIPLD